MEITQRIFDLLQQQNKKQSDLARFLDVRVATISEWKRNRCTPSVSVIGKIAEFLGVSVDYLVTGKEYTPAPSQTVNQGIFGDRNHNNTVTINGNGAVEISEFESELIRMCARLAIRRKTALLTYAYKLENEMSEGN